MPMEDILILGSSLVTGTLGAKWVDSICKPDQYTIHNHGIDGIQIPGIINFLKTSKLTIKPFAIVIVAGGNDMTCSLLPDTTEGYSKMTAGRLGRPPSTPEQFEIEFEELLSLIKQIFGDKVRIGIGNIKIVGEDVNGNINNQVRAYNKILDAIIIKQNNMTLIDFYNPICALSKARYSDKNASIVPIVGSDDISQIFNPGRMVKVKLWHDLTLGYYTYDYIGESYGFYCTCDGSHFNERSAAIACKVVGGYLEKLKSK